MFTYIYLHLVHFYGKFVSKYTGLVPWESGSHGLDSHHETATAMAPSRWSGGAPSETQRRWPDGGNRRNGGERIHGTMKRRYIPGQIITTSAEVTLNGGLVREIPLFQGNLGWWNIIIWPDIWMFPKIGVVFYPPQNIHLFIGVSMKKIIHFGGPPHFWKHPYLPTNWSHKNQPIIRIGKYTSSAHVSVMGNTQKYAPLN